MANKALLAIDIGSTNTKAMAFTVDGRELASDKVTTPLQQNNEGLYYDAELIWGAVADVLAGLSKKLKAVGYESVSLAVTGYGNDGVALDKSGNQLYPFISWKCNRFVGQFERFMDSFGHKHVFDCTGVQARPVDTLYKWMWLNDNHPEVLEKADSFLMLQDYINFRLTGEKVSDPTVAFTTSAFDPAVGNWSEEVTKAAGVRTDYFPRVGKSGEMIGRVTKAAAERTGLPEGLPVSIGGWDIICSSFSIGAYRKGYLMDILGSWETLMASDESYIRTDEVYKMGLNACNHVASGYFAYPVYFVSSSLVEWFLDTQFRNQGTMGGDIYGEFIAEVEKSEPLANGTLFLPHLYGAAAPVVDSRSRGAFVGLTNLTTRGDMGRSVLEGLGYMCKQVQRGFEDFLKGDVEHIIFCGGGSRNKPWCQIKSDIAGCNAEIETCDETTALGAALKGAVGAGVFANDLEAVSALETVRIPVNCRPEMVAEYAKVFPIYDALYSALKPVNESIFKQFNL